eukprot:g14098.t1
MVNMLGKSCKKLLSWACACAALGSGGLSSSTGVAAAGFLPVQQNGVLACTAGFLPAEDIKKQLLQDLAKWLSSLGLERYLTAANHWCYEIMGAIDVDEIAPYILSDGLIDQLDRFETLTEQERSRLLIVGERSRLVGRLVYGEEDEDMGEDGAFGQNSFFGDELEDGDDRDSDVATVFGDFFADQAEQEADEVVDEPACRKRKEAAEAAAAAAAANKRKKQADEEGKAPKRRRGFAALNSR